MKCEAWSWQLISIYCRCNKCVELYVHPHAHIRLRDVRTLKEWRSVCVGSIWSHAIKVKAKWPRYRPGVAQRVGRGIAALFHDRGTRRGWVVSSTPRPYFTHQKDPVPVLQEAGWAPGPVWMGGKSRPHRDSIPDSPARSQSRYRLSYRAHSQQTKIEINVHQKLTRLQSGFVSEKTLFSRSRESSAATHTHSRSKIITVESQNFEETYIPLH